MPRFLGHLKINRKSFIKIITSSMQEQRALCATQSFIMLPKKRREKKNKKKNRPWQIMQTNYTKLVEIYALRVSLKNKNNPQKKVNEKFFSMEKNYKKRSRMRRGRSRGQISCRAHNPSTFINQFNFCRSAWEPGRPVLGSFKAFGAPTSDRWQIVWHNRT